MKYLKSFESTIKDEPKLYDYVVCRDKFFNDPVVLNFISNNIGQIVELNYPNAVDKIKNTTYEIRYKNVPLNCADCFEFNLDKDSKTGDILEHRDEILFFSPNKEKAEQFIQSNKYNL